MEQLMGLVAVGLAKELLVYLFDKGVLMRTAVRGFLVIAVKARSTLLPYFIDAA
jgi:hypothetical protein